MKIIHIIIIVALLIIVYMLWPSQKSKYASLVLETPREKCGAGLPPCPPGHRCYIEPSSGNGICSKIAQKCGDGLPPCPRGHRCYVDPSGEGYCA